MAKRLNLHLPRATRGRWCINVLGRREFILNEAIALYYHCVSPIYEDDVVTGCNGHPLVLCVSAFLNRLTGFQGETDCLLESLLVAIKES